mmetsp:Transcript_8359/g.17031  ORF Transcript_8359/g.17031 Transcript_8359/m.17031 type:complete len:83 (+) Transcript_8359:208-456(+)
MRTWILPRDPEFEELHWTYHYRRPSKSLNITNLSGNQAGSHENAVMGTYEGFSKSSLLLSLRRTGGLYGINHSFLQEKISAY